MANITLSIPDDIYKKMKKHREVKWSEVVRRAILEYLKRIEEGGFEMTTKELLKELGEEFKKSLEELSIAKAIEGYEKARDAEWKRISTTRAN
jgi:predicted CopG family antitoxin